jgi:hypothetical protein
MHSSSPTEIKRRVLNEEDLLCAEEDLFHPTKRKKIYVENNVKLAELHFFKRDSDIKSNVAGFLWPLNSHIIILLDPIDELDRGKKMYIAFKSGNIGQPFPHAGGSSIHANKKMLRCEFYNQQSRGFSTIVETARHVCTDEFTHKVEVFLETIFISNAAWKSASEVEKRKLRTMVNKNGSTLIAIKHIYIVDIEHLKIFSGEV